MKPASPEKPEKLTLETLLYVGLKPVGSFQIDTRKEKLALEINAINKPTPAKAGVYLWVLKNKVVYVGVAQNICARHVNHCCHPKKPSKAKCNLFKAIKAGRKVSLYWLGAPIEHEGLKVRRHLGIRMPSSARNPAALECQRRH